MTKRFVEIAPGVFRDPDVTVIRVRDGQWIRPRRFSCGTCKKKAKCREAHWRKGRHQTGCWLYEPSTQTAEESDL